MKIGYFGDGPWSHAALDRIAEDAGLQICFVVARDDNPDPVLRRRAGELGVPFLTHPNVNSEEFLERLRPFAADINVSMSFNQIIRRQLLDATPLGFINCHAGALPFYRGRNILNWALANGESRFGITVHYIDEGIDTGDIIRQDFAEITRSDNYGTLLEKAYDLCADTLYQAIDSIRNGTATRTLQDTIHPVGFYCGRRGPGDEWLDWNWSAERVFNFVRSIALPGPCARTVVDDKQIAILAAETIEQAPDYIATVGEVVGRSEAGVVVKTGDSTILVTRVADVSADGSLAEERIPRFRIGRRFTADLFARVLDLESRLADLESRIGAAD